MMIVVNPTSGKGKAARMAAAVADRLRAAGVQTTVCHTLARGDAGRITHQSCADGTAPPDAVVACGGDGTVQEVAHALAILRPILGEQCPALGLAPAGRCNDFARALGVFPRPDLVVDRLLHAAAQPVDLGRVNERYFCTVATAGIDAEVSQYVDTMRMPLTGTIAYLYGALRVLARYRPRGLHIEGDFGVIDRPVFIASGANTSSYGGAVPIAPDASPTDGQLDLCVIEFMSRLKALGMIPAVLRGKHLEHPGVQLVRTKRLTIRAPAPLALWADGEPVGQTPAIIDVVPGAVRVLRS
jgi:diacylglycerol kinase (ATP)